MSEVTRNEASKAALNLSAALQSCSQDDIRWLLANCHTFKYLFDTVRLMENRLDSPWVGERVEMDGNFEPQWMNEPPHPHREIAREYFERTERFDRRHCPPDGIPKNDKQVVMVTRNSLRVIMELSRELLNAGGATSMQAAELVVWEAIREFNEQEVR